jgi:hypothetical protein
MLYSGRNWPPPLNLSALSCCISTNGCFCKYCSLKRKDIYFRAKKGEKNFEKIIHQEVVNKVHEERKQNLYKIIKNNNNNKKYSDNQFSIKLK